jgi:hypothetical protein
MPVPNPFTDANPKRNFFFSQYHRKIALISRAASFLNFVVLVHEKY